MAIGLSLQPDMSNISMGPVPVSLATVTGDASYPLGGYSIYPRMTAMRGILGIVPLGNNSAANGYTLVYNSQTQNLLVMQSGAASAPETEINAGQNISTFSWTVLVIGIR